MPPRLESQPRRASGDRPSPACRRPLATSVSAHADEAGSYAAALIPAHRLDEEEEEEEEGAKNKVPKSPS